MPCSAPILVPRIQAVDRRLLCSRPLGGCQLGFNGPKDGLNDLILHIKDVCKLAIVLGRPELNPVGCVDQLDTDPDTIARSTDAATDHVAYAKIARHLFRLNVPSLVAEARAARDHAQPSYTRESCNQILCDAVGKVFLRDLPANICHGQNSNARPVGEDARSVLGSCRLHSLLL